MAGNTDVMHYERLRRMILVDYPAQNAPEHVVRGWTEKLVQILVSTWIFTLLMARRLY